MTVVLGAPHVHLREVGSTNERARALGSAGAPHGTLVTAGAQSAGRGRQGRHWVAAAGEAVLMSLVLRGLEDRHAGLPLAAAVAVCEACEACAPVSCAIKWPNDVWIEGRKVAGILIEGRPQEGWAALGIGVNVTTGSDGFPENLRGSATSLALAAPDSGDAEVDDVLEAMLFALDRWLGAKPGDVIGAWRARDALRDRRVRWSAGEGEARGVSADGSLIVDTAEGRVELDAGEVHLLR